MEAMTYGLPVVVTRRGGLPELVDRGGGIVYEPGDETSLAEILAMLMVDETMCWTLGREAQTIAVEEFTAARHRESLEGVYRSLSSMGSRGTSS
jgi:glycosyltransferase involved in cell wall biosynthesis